MSQCVTFHLNYPDRGPIFVTFRGAASWPLIGLNEPLLASDWSTPCQPRLWGLMGISQSVGRWAYLALLMRCPSPIISQSEATTTISRPIRGPRLTQWWTVTITDRRIGFAFNKTQLRFHLHLLLSPLSSCSEIELFCKFYCLNSEEAEREHQWAVSSCDQIMSRVAREERAWGMEDWWSPLLYLSSWTSVLLTQLRLNALTYLFIGMISWLNFQQARLEKLPIACCADADVMKSKLA